MRPTQVRGPGAPHSRPGFLFKAGRAGFVALQAMGTSFCTACLVTCQSPGWILSRSLIQVLVTFARLVRFVSQPLNVIAPECGHAKSLAEPDQRDPGYLMRPSARGALAQMPSGSSHEGSAAARPPRRLSPVYSGRPPWGFVAHCLPACLLCQVTCVAIRRARICLLPCVCTVSCRGRLWLPQMLSPSGAGATVRTQRLLSAPGLGRVRVRLRLRVPPLVAVRAGSLPLLQQPSTGNVSLHISPSS